MFVVTVTFDLRHGAMDAFMPLVLAQAEASLRDEPACHRFDVARPERTPSQVFLYEIYENGEAFQHHLRTPHFLQFDKDASPLVAVKKVRLMELVSPHLP